MERRDKARITRSVPFNTNEGFHSGLGDDLVVVLANPRFLAGDVGPL